MKSGIAELARDLIAFGSIPFLILTVIRVSFTEPYYPFEFIIGSAVFFPLMALVKAEMRSGLGLMMLVFVSLYYHSALFAVFAALVYIGMLVSLVYLRRGRREIVKGILCGAVSTVTGYAAAGFIFPHG